MQVQQRARRPVPGRPYQQTGIHLWIAAPQIGQNSFRRATVMHVSGMNENVENQPLRIKHQMALAAGDPLAPIITALTAGLAGAGGLAVDDRRMRLRRASLINRHVPFWRHRRK